MRCITFRPLSAFSWAVLFLCSMPFFLSFLSKQFIQERKNKEQTDTMRNRKCEWLQRWREREKTGRERLERKVADVQSLRQTDGQADLWTKRQKGKRETDRWQAQTHKGLKGMQIQHNTKHGLMFRVSPFFWRDKATVKQRSSSDK